MTPANVLAAIEYRLQQAERHKDAAERSTDGGAYDRSVAEMHYNEAAIYAAAAQAAALTRIADTLDRLVSSNYDNTEGFLRVDLGN